MASCPFSVGDIVRFSPSGKTRNHYQDSAGFGVETGQELAIRSIKDGMYLYFDKDAGGWPWNEFTLVHQAVK